MRWIRSSIVGLSVIIIFLLSLLKCDGSDSPRGSENKFVLNVFSDEEKKSDSVFHAEQQVQGSLWQASTLGQRENQRQQEQEQQLSRNDIDINNIFGNPARIINVPAGMTLQQAGYLAFPEAKELEDQTDIGGTKFIAEWAADREKKYTSVFDRPEQIRVKNLEDSKLKLYDNLENIAKLIIDGRIAVNVGRVKSGDREFTVNVNIHNLTNQPIRVIVEQGQLLEVQTSEVQSIVVRQEAIIELQPGERKNTSLKAFCASEHRRLPYLSLDPIKFTPFILVAPPSAFSSQRDVWDFISRNRK
jgi:hypothetical protein